MSSFFVLVLVTTASAPDESSWSFYCDDGTCLGDLYSISWLRRLEKVSFINIQGIGAAPMGGGASGGKARTFLNEFLEPFC